MKLSLLRFLRSLSVLLAQQGGNVTPTPLANNPTLVATAGAQGSQGVFAGVLYVHVTGTTDTHWLDLGLAEAVMQTIANTGGNLLEYDLCVRGVKCYQLSKSFGDFVAAGGSSQAVLALPALPTYPVPPAVVRTPAIVFARLVVGAAFMNGAVPASGALYLGKSSLGTSPVEPLLVNDLAAIQTLGAAGSKGSGSPADQPADDLRLMLEYYDSAHIDTDLTAGRVDVYIYYV